MSKGELIAKLKKDLQATDDYEGLKVGDEVTVQFVTSSGPATVIKTCGFGALVRFHKPGGVLTDEMYVRHQNPQGNWYR